MKEKESFEVIEILQNVIVIYTDNIEEHFEAIRVTDRGIIIGKIIDKKFEPFGFIPNHSIKQINNGSGKKIS